MQMAIGGTRTLRRVGVAAAAASALALVVSPPARPGLVDGLLSPCSGQQLSKPFLPWLDVDSYALAGDGGFESGAAGWKLAGGAVVVGGNEPWHVRGASDDRSLYLPQGATAVSPSSCTGLHHPTARLFARSSGGVLEVDATVTLLGLSIQLPVGLVLPGSNFAPTLPLPLLANFTAPLAGSTAGVVLRFTALGGPVWIDDVYVDPFKVN
jgi:hypothetical protein